jgi:hypothetical protein
LIFVPLEFIAGYAMGTAQEMPAYKNCEEFQFQVDSLSFKENSEYEISKSLQRRKGDSPLAK